LFFDVNGQTVPSYPANGGSYYRPQIPAENLSALEKYALNKTYPREYPLQRLERLENLAFGSIQYGDLETRYRNVENAILSRGRAVPNKRNVWSSLGNYFAGQMTGYTPPVQNYGNYYSYPEYGLEGSNYGTQRIDQFSNGIFGGGYNLMNQNLGTGSSIRILP